MKEVDKKIGERVCETGEKETMEKQKGGRYEITDEVCETEVKKTRRYVH